jgi:integrase/recombinase XerD
MNRLRPALADYLALRRALGFALTRDEKLLIQFVTYLEDHGRDTITVADALAWAGRPTGASPGWLGFRMRVVRSFATYLHSIDADAQIPPPGLLAGQGRRAVPYLYSDTEITALMDQARRVPTPLRAGTITTFIGLMAATGMRAGEVVGLDDADLDIQARLLLVRRAKGGRQRLVPVHPTTIAALVDYRRLRDHAFPRPVSPALLVSTAGTRLLYYNVGQTFAKLARAAGLQPRSASCRPRPHDLRHTFAVATLLDWYRDGGDIAARLPLLSTYLGHVSPANTYWYYSDSRDIPMVA